ncbi:unnamed protein product [Orchesella dallaii]|uniref:Uncharacterized protein n=1 Tax=Orchesella dallaii TaxID=48710 RepID=A0ABP1PLG1_9HEXA
MKLAGVFLVLFGIQVATHSALGKPQIFKAVPNNEDNALDLEVALGGTDVIRAHGKLGLSHPSSVGDWTNCDNGDPNAVCIQWGDYAQVVLKDGPALGCGSVEWTSAYARQIEDCYDLEEGVHWYGGGEMFTQIWPIETRPRQEGAYVTADSMASNEGQFGGVVENYWLLSNGAAIVIAPDTPLFFSLNTTHPNRVCFIAKDQNPFTQRSPLSFNYTWCTAENVKAAHQLAHGTFFDKPNGIPDEEMLIRPLWSTWAQYKADVNQSIVLDFARRVVSEGFGNASHIEIDDNWEPCYGQETFDTVKFPDPKAMVDEIKAMNMRVTLWVHPFINYGCPLFNEGMSNGYLVKDAKGKTGITSWWQGGNAGIIDVTNPDAAAWWVARLQKLQEETGVDAFKFDAGETNWLPASNVLAGGSEMWPQIYSTKYVETCATFGGLIETRTAHLNQATPFFVRMLDKDSRWGYNNGLQSMIPTLLQFSIAGYPFVLPDMIGGNAYGEWPSKELYVRWLQANIFMPAVQFSVVPWEYDSETIQICLAVLAQREMYRDDILAAARQAAEDGSPINRPIWWVDPTDENTFTIDNAYMLGDKILVAPVVEEGAVSRDIYLPAGTWTSGVDSEVITGPTWLRNYPAPLNVVPFFVKSA